MRFLLYILLLMISDVALGQTNIPKEDSIILDEIRTVKDILIDKLYAYSNQDDLREKYISDIQNEVIENYNQFLIRFPESRYTNMVLKEKANAELLIDNFENAKNSCLKLLQSIENNRGKNKDEFAAYWESNQFLSYIYKDLTKIELHNKNYTEAIKYLDEIKNHSYRFVCGNEHLGHIISIANMSSEAYLGLNEYEKAYDVLLPFIFYYHAQSLREKLYYALLQKYKKEDLKRQFEHSFNNVTVEKEKNTVKYILTFLNRKIELNIWEFRDIDPSKKEDFDKKLKEILKKSDFYALLSQ